MKIAHFGDLHFGFRAYNRTTAGGANQREADVAKVFRQAVSQVAERQPDLVVYAGDIFDTPYPTPAVMREALVRTQGVFQATGAVQVFVGGNHDHPRKAGHGNPLTVLHQAVPKSVIILDEPEVVPIPDLGCHVVGLPHGSYSAERMMESARTARATQGESILVVHAPIEVRGEDRLMYARMSGESVPLEVLDPEQWTYVAAGDFHEYIELAPNAFYSGSLEFVNAGPWNEMRRKGWVLYDTETREHEFVEVSPRTVHSADLNVHELSSGEIMELLEDQVGAWDGLEGKIARIVLDGATPETMRSLDWERIRPWKGQALHFHLVHRAPEVSTGETTQDQPEWADTDGRPLEEEVGRYIEEDWNPPSGLDDRKPVREFAIECLDAED